MDRSCGSCLNNLIARTVNSRTCDICPTGRYRVDLGAASCQECASSSAGLGNYNYCYDNGNGGQRDIRVCNGHDKLGSTQCAEGYGISGQCSGTTSTNPACTVCAEGTERPSGTPYAAMVQGAGIQTCIRCATGKYKTGASASNCVACTNKPAANSTYNAWAATAVPSTNACPWDCNAGFYKSGTSCLACPTGKYSGAAATVCALCTLKPSANTYYIGRADGQPSTSDTCPWDCNAGYVKNALLSGCATCGTGYYRDAAKNRASEAQAINSCYQCSTCLEREYRSSACVITQNTVCISCSTSCARGYYQDTACTATANRHCALCQTKCPVGKYLSSVRVCSGTTDYDQVLAACIPCKVPGDCPAGFYLSSTCPGTGTTSNVCLQCTLVTCAAGQYRGYCGGYTNTQCTNYRTCLTGQYLAGESQDSDGICVNCSTCETGEIRACTRYEDVVCDGEPCSAMVPCARRSSVSRLSYFCDFSRGAEYASCGVCPHGHGSDGQYCLECARGSTCDIKGVVACKGQCRAGVLSSCESPWDLGYVGCDKTCELTSMPAQLPWRGTYTYMEGANCGVYFRCQAGYYKLFGTGGTAGCEPCTETRPTLGVRDRWVTEGLSVGDATSCLWECKRELAILVGATCQLMTGRTQGGGWNQAGSWAGSAGSGTCRQGYTSEAQTAMSIGECRACPALNTSTQRPRATQCEWECIEYGAARLGGKCVRPRTDCLAEGVTEIGDVCLVTSYPWNRPGHRKTDWGLPVLSQYTGQPWDTTEPVLFTTRGYGVQGRHRLTLLDGTVRTMPGPVCSGVLGDWNGKAYMFGALCNQSFLVYLDLTMGSTMGILIGNSTRGWRDGFRTQALFEDELYVASGGPGRLFVLDRWNCLLREVVLGDEPGGYLNRVYTVWGVTSELEAGQPRCYGDGSLAWPRKFWDLPGDWLAFASEDGLWQFNTDTRELTPMVWETDGQFEADDLAWVELTDEFTLRLWFKGGVRWTVEAGQERCPADWTSLAGGECIMECRRSNGKYVDPSTGVCRPCTSLACGVGQEAVACGADTDGYCTACENTSGLVYTQAGLCEASTRHPAPPCLPGWYAVASGLYCELCPAYTATRLAGAGRIEQCKCLDGLSRRDGDCVGERLNEFEETRVCAGSCPLPGHARLVRAEACVWECNAGYYRDTWAGFADQCRPCRSGTLTNGDDDQPWSCE